MPNASRITRTSRVANCVPTTVDWGVPSITLAVEAPAGMFVRLNVAGVETPATIAFTANCPAIVFAVKTDAASTPLLPVCPVNVFDAPVNVPEAPEEGAVNVTETPGTGLPNTSKTVTRRFVAYAVFTCALWGVPAVGLIVAAGPDAFVRLNDAGVVTPATAPVTTYDPATVSAVNVGALATPLPFVVTFTDR